MTNSGSLIRLGLFCFLSCFCLLPGEAFSACNCKECRCTANKGCGCMSGGPCRCNTKEEPDRLPQKRAVQEPGK